MATTGFALTHIVEQQCRRWELLRKERQREAAVWPVITISREFGAQGEAVGRIIAERTGFALWDKELVHELAEETGANEAILASLDEHRRTDIMDSINGALMGGVYMKSEYVRRLTALVQTVADHGSGIIIGRGAAIILDDEPALRVRVICPFDERAHAYAERQGIDEKRARSKLSKEDKDRAHFVRKNLLRDTTDPANYDLIVNTGSLTLEQAADVILSAYEIKFARRPPEA